MTTEAPSSDMVVADTPRTESSVVRHRKKTLYQQIMRIMEFYLSDSNLRKDRFFNNLMQESPEIDIQVFLKCNKLARLTSNPEDIVRALKKSTLLQVTEDGTKVKRTEDVLDKPDVDECTIYVEKLPPDAEHEYIEKVFSKYGKVTYVSLPKFKSTGKLKGFAFVEFSSKEEASKALEAYTEMGCCLPSTMPPESLISIQTFEGKKSNLTQQENLLPNQSPASKKNSQIKTGSNQTSSSSLSADVSSLDQKPDSPPAKRQKLTASKSSDVDEKPETNVDDTTDQETPNNTSDPPGKKKKSRKKKKKNNPETNSDDSGMQVLSKTEWKKLRNQYLNLQRTKMNKLKTHLQSIKRTQWTHPHFVEKKKKETAVEKKDVKEEEGKDLKYGVEFVAGTIVRVHLDEALVDVKLFKNELKHKPNVKYVDATVGSQEVFVRCISAEEATNMVEAKCFPHCDILKGEEEILYWEKIEYDRRVKLSWKSTKPSRGRNKLLKKAEKALGKHIRFDTVAEEEQ